jgi:hypothetical protein
MANEEKKSKFGAALDGTLKSVYIDGELNVVRGNSTENNQDFESMLDIIGCERTEGEYDWHSDSFFPVYPAIYLTQSSLDASQLSMTRDYSDVFLQDGSDEAKKKAAAAKELINRTLNQRHLHYFQKYMRAQAIRRLNDNGVVWRCWWERKDEPVVTGFKNTPVEDTVDVHGQPMMDRSVQVPAMKNMMEPVVEHEPLFDRFNCDVIDPRNVFMSDEYTYSIQDKRFVYLRFEKTLDQLEDEEEQYGYINLDLLEKVEPPDETDTSKESFNKDAGGQKSTNNASGTTFDIIERYGKGWVVVTDRDPVTGMPLKAEPGYDEFGKKKDKAELQEICVAWAKSAGNYTLIRHHLTAYVDTRGNPYRPLVRGLCYIHPSKDGGMGDGPVAREAQVSINDTLNMSNDRVRLATFPVIKVNAYDAEESESVYEFRPGHRMELSDINNAAEFKISPDVSGAMTQMGVLTNLLHQGIGIYPPQMGDSPGTDITATATAASGAHANIRSAYQSLTAEHTMLTELYWLILQMTGKFAHPKTGEYLMGEKLYDFDPNADYFYRPVTSAIEPEASKFQTRKDTTTMFGYSAQVQNPNTPKVLNALLKIFYESFGDKYESIGAMYDETAPAMPPTQGGMIEQGGPLPVSNQTGVPMSPMEQSARMIASPGGPPRGQ